MTSGNKPKINLSRKLRLGSTSRLTAPRRPLEAADLGFGRAGSRPLLASAHQPAALKAIAAVYGTDDRYSDDMHFDGGALCGFELTNYPMRMIAMNALPPLARVSWIS